MGFYHEDKVNLRFPGIRTFVHNMHDSCPILTKKQMFQTSHGNTHNHNRPARSVQRNGRRPFRHGRFHDY